MKKKMTRGIVFIVAMSLLTSPATLFGYMVGVHEEITSKAIEKCDELDGSLRRIGFENGVEHIMERGFLRGEKSIGEWMQYGSYWEDLILLKEKFHTEFKTCHFYDPISGMGFYDDRGYEIGQSLIDRANDSAGNEWSYPMAKDLFHAALTGDSMEHAVWDMNERFLDKAWCSGRGNMSEEQRDQFFTWAFQALGHTLHLVQDASVPAHTRNDAHGYKGLEAIWSWELPGETDPYETWTNSHKDDEDAMNYHGDGSDSWTNWKDAGAGRADSFPNFFIDMDRLGRFTPEPLTGLNQGLAEYSHANFFSRDSVSDFDLPANFQLQSYGEERSLLEFEYVGGEWRTFVYMKSRDAEGPEHLLLCGILYHRMNGPVGRAFMDTLFTVEAPKVHQDYAKKLIPRAVGYSAGLLDYFFRGKIDMVPAEIGSGYLIKNESEEDMDGRFELYYDDRDDGRRRPVKDGWGRPVRWDLRIAAGGSKTVTADFPARDGMDDPERCMLVFRGRLGNEDDAVVGRIVGPLRDYLHVRIGRLDDSEDSNFTDQVIVWDLAMGWPATHIRDDDGRIAKFPCEAGKISKWHENGKRRRIGVGHGATEIWNTEAENMDRADPLGFVAHGKPAKPEGWNVVNHGYTLGSDTCGDHVESCHNFISGPCVEMACTDGRSECTNSIRGAWCWVVSREPTKMPLEKISTGIICDEVEGHTWGHPDLPDLRRESTYEISQDVELTKTYSLGVDFASGWIETEFRPILHASCKPTVRHTERNGTVEDDAVSNHWGSGTLKCLNDSGVDSFVRTHHHRIWSESSESYPKWRARTPSEGELCVKETGGIPLSHDPWETPTYSVHTTGSDTYKFHTHFGQLGEVTLKRDFTKIVTEGSTEFSGHESQIPGSVRKVETLSSGRALAQIFLCHFPIGKYDMASGEYGSGTERRTFVHAQAALTDSGQDAREADPTRHTRSRNLETEMEDAIEAIYMANPLGSDDMHHDLKVRIEFLQ